MAVFNTIILIIQFAAALLLVRTFHSRTVTDLYQDFNSPRFKFQTDVWLPIILLAPILGAYRHIENHAVPNAGMTFTLPIVMGLIAIALAMITKHAARQENNTATANSLPLIIAGATGIVMLLLSIINKLQVGIGQTLFAVFAVMLWINTPTFNKEESKHPKRKADATLPVLITLAFVQTICAAVISDEWLKISGGIAILEAVIILTISARTIGPAFTRRLGLWTAIYGALLTPGLLSLITLARYATTRNSEPSGNIDGLRILHGITDGFANFAMEAAILAAMPLIIIATRKLQVVESKVLGALLIIFAAILAASRLAAM